MTKKHIQARRDRNRALADLDVQHRCAHCKTVLNAVRLQMGERFCSMECAEDFAAFSERWAEARARVEK